MRWPIGRLVPTDDTKHHGATLNGLCELVIRRAKRSEPVEQGTRLGAGEHVLRQALERLSAGIRKHHVEQHDTGSLLDQLIHERCKELSPPGPAAEPLHRWLVDVDDAYWIRGVRNLLGAACCSMSKPSRRKRARSAGFGQCLEDAGRKNAGDDQPIGKACAHDGLLPQPSARCQSTE